MQKIKPKMHVSEKKFSVYFMGSTDLILFC